MRYAVKANQQRDAEIRRLHNIGLPLAEIARRFAISPGRVGQVVTSDEFRTNHRNALVAKYGKDPNISKMPDDTPLEVLTLCDGKVQAWATRVMRLPFAAPPIKNLGELRRASDIQLLTVDGVGKKLVVELRRFCPANPSATVKRQRGSRSDARAALRMIRKVVEARAPPGSVPQTNGHYVKEAEALIKGILAIAKLKDECGDV